jgi:SAM-dependent methyltransferase
MNPRGESETDRHWNQRAASVENDVEVNVMDLFQRELELDHVLGYLEPEMIVVEVGCGNGYSTRRIRECVRHVDAFDFAENMIARARRVVGETNNRFIQDDILAPREIQGPYDCAICVRVLINLRDLPEQLTATRNIADLLHPGGRLILVEGFAEGFDRLSKLRLAVGLTALQPASINFYSRFEDVRNELDAHFELETSFHLGAYDYLTRVVYPVLVAPQQPTHNTVLSERFANLSREFNADDFAPLSRIRGLVLRKRPQGQ